MLLDDMNAKGMDSKLLLLDAHPNIEIRVYNPFRNRDGIGRIVELAQRFFSVNHPMHNKALALIHICARSKFRHVGRAQARRS